MLIFLVTNYVYNLSFVENTLFKFFIFKTLNLSIKVNYFFSWLNLLDIIIKYIISRLSLFMFKDYNGYLFLFFSKNLSSRLMPL
jgi:hypothetical protein